MHPDLERLIRLHEADATVHAVEVELAQCPTDKSALEARLNEERESLDAARAAFEATTKSRRKLEAEVQDLETKRAKYKGQLGDVKTNKEYQALLHEIEGVEREIRSREDLVLEEMERLETFGAEVKREAVELKQVEARHSVEMKELEARLAALEARAAARRTERDVALSDTSEEAQALYRRVARLRSGVALAEVKDGSCSGCRVKLRPQLVLNLKRNDEVVQCPSCSRILFFVPEPPTIDPVP